MSKVQCLGKTGKGTQCTRSAFEDDIYCKIHIKKHKKSKELKREKVNIIYHTHPPSKKVYPNCPRCIASLENLTTCLKIQ